MQGRLQVRGRGGRRRGPVRRVAARALPSLRRAKPRVCGVRACKSAAAAAATAAAADPAEIDIDDDADDVAMTQTAL